MHILTGTAYSLYRVCTDCLSANQIKEFVPYFNQYTKKEIMKKVFENIGCHCDDVGPIALQWISRDKA